MARCCQRLLLLRSLGICGFKLIMGCLFPCSPAVAEGEGGEAKLGLMLECGKSRAKSKEIYFNFP